MRPIAVLISDVHYSVHTLKLADTAMRMAIDKANELGIPLIVAGDLHDTKANLRGECVNAMIETFSKTRICYVLRGNHDQINEKSKEHSINFLRKDNIFVIDEPEYAEELGLYLIPYHHDANELRKYLSTISEGSTIIMHQGLTSSSAGHYIQDKSAIDPEDVRDFRTISGHYHTRQDIKTGRPRQGAVGLFSYIGNPYTLGFGEATDPEKGFQILMDNGILEFVPTNLRKHVIVDITLHETPIAAPTWKDNDLVWLKIRGSKEELYKINRSNTKAEFLNKSMSLPEHFKLDLIPIGTTTDAQNAPGLTQGDLLESLIDSLTNTSKERIERLKTMLRDLCE